MTHVHVGIALKDFNESAWLTVVKKIFDGNDVLGIDLKVHDKAHTEAM